ncbi:MAG: ATPase [Acidimicrobiales bacterium mtb01]|nr:cation-translocating P-type ATPase [Actinomycetota bacterium]TEX46855.1 MAG: ATPase [Acidimicrobiales bacterium mtb01]
MLALLLVAAVVNFFLAEPIDGFIIFSFVAIVIGISITQSVRAENAVMALRDLTAPPATVVRSGRTTRIPSTDVVVGDLLLLNEGDRVAADGTIVESIGLTVDESVLTGESLPIEKSLGPSERIDDRSLVFSGTLVGRGRAVVHVDQIGTATRLGRIGASIESIEASKTPLQRQIDRIVGIIGIGAVLVAICATTLHGWLRDDWLEGTLSGIAVGMSMLPEEFPVVFTIFLTVGAWRMSRHQVLTRRTPVIESLGAMSVVCVDKTGTLTMNHLTVVEVAPTGSPLGSIDRNDASHRRLALVGRLACPEVSHDPVDRAFVEFSDHWTSDDHDVSARRQLIREYPLGDHLMAVVDVWKFDGRSGHVVVAKGAPEAIGSLTRLTGSDRGRMEATVAHGASRGLKMLAVAQARWSDDDVPDDPTSFDFEFIGLVGLKDPLRPGVVDAVHQLRSAGIRTVMITGDHPVTATAIAQEVGIARPDRCLLGDDLDDLNDEQLIAVADGVDVFARTRPGHKLRLVRALQTGGAVVGMTGDGVNDAPALKAADIGIAMGGRGTDVAREAASIVLTDDSLPSIVDGVRRGRGIYDNIRKAFAYVVAMHAPIIGMTAIPLFISDWPLVLLPIQIGFLELIIDPACSVVFEAESVDPEVMNRPPRAARQTLFGRRELTTAVLQGLSALASSLIVYLWAIETDHGDATIRSIVFLSLVTSNVGLILINRSWRLGIFRTFRQRRNPALPWLVVAVVAISVLIFVLEPVRTTLDFGPITIGDAAVAMTTAILGLAWFEIAKVTGRVG